MFRTDCLILETRRSTSLEYVTLPVSLPAAFNLAQKYPRTTGQISVIDALYSSKVHDYCNEGDPVCASGDNLQAHLEYSEKWDTIASSWLVSMLQ